MVPEATGGMTDEHGSSDGASELAFPAFPYPPYDIQVGFMRSLYLALEQGGVGLFESPTGTGKTLSLICSSLQWLEDARRREQQQAASQPGRQAGSSGAAAGAAGTEGPGSNGGGNLGGGNEASDDDEPDWLRDYSAQKEAEERRAAEAARVARLAAVRAGLLQRAAGAGGKAEQRAQPPGGGTGEALDPDAEFLVEGRESEGEGGHPAGGSAAKRRRLNGGGSGAALGYDSSDDGGSGEDEAALGGLGEAQAPPPPKKTQVIFSSRTHSQLSQFVGELRRTTFQDSLSLVALASRKALCINDSVLALGSPALINERCLDMQRAKPGGSKGGKGKKASGRCPFLACGTKAAATTHDIILAQPMDIEELASLGRRKSVCPYYAARRALPEADVVLAPYASLLVADTREALGLTLADKVVIVDEGHNLVEAINSSHSAEVSAGQLAAARAQLSAYFDRFRTQLAPGNARHLQTLTHVATTLSRQLAPQGAAPGAAAEATAATRPPGTSGGGGSASSIGNSGGLSLGGAGGQQVSVHTVNDFLLATGLDNLNLFRLVRYIKESKAVFKVAGFAQAQAQRAAKAAAAAGSAAGTAGGSAAGAAGAASAGEGGGGSTGALHALVGFMQALTNDDSDGRVILDRAGGSLRFVLLNAAAHFAKVVSAARSVVLASGTLSPIEPVLQLFPFTPRDLIHRYSCGHVVSRDRLLALAVGSGPSGVRLDFRHDSRALPATLDELGRLVTNVAKVVPGGVVVFFPSFSYADQVYARWEATGVLRQLSARKRVFREPRSAGEVECLLQDYAACIQACSSGSSSSGGNGGGGGASGAVPAGGKENAGGGGAAARQLLAQQAQQACGGGLTGAVLLCVVGGKLSEGINFGDALGRCVVMVGLPYPNPSDPELQERLRYIDRQQAAAQQAQQAAQQQQQQQQAQQQAATAPATAGSQPAAIPTPAVCPRPPQQQHGQPGPGGPSTSQALVPKTASAPSSTAASRQHYEDLCMKAVNQCVGRVVRHARDYAAILLVDARYAAAAAAMHQAAAQAQQASQQAGAVGLPPLQGRQGAPPPGGPLAKLPGWVRECLAAPGGGAAGTFGEAYSQLARFFKRVEAANGA